MSRLRPLLPRTRRPEYAVPALSIIGIGLAFVLLPVAAGQGIRLFDVYNGLQGFALLGFVALALGLTMMAGEFDLSVAGMHAVGGVLAVLTGAADPVLGVIAGACAGIVVGAVQGGIIAFGTLIAYDHPRLQDLSHPRLTPF